MPRPRSFRCGPFTFAIDWTVAGWSAAANSSASFDADAARYYGYTDRGSCTVWINPHAAPAFQREALLHEVMHCCQLTAGLPNLGTTTGEEFITRLAPVLLDTLDRNPRLRAYLLGAP